MIDYLIDFWYLTALSAIS